MHVMRFPLVLSSNAFFHGETFNMVHKLLEHLCFHAMIGEKDSL